MFNMSGNRQQIADLEIDTVLSASKDSFTCTIEGTVKILLMDITSRLGLNGEY